MNRKGQVLVLFIILLPIILLLIYFVGNRIYLYGEKNNQERLINILCFYYQKEKDENKVILLSNKNDKNQIIDIKYQDDTIKITLIKEYTNILNKKNKIKTTTVCR